MHCHFKKLLLVSTGFFQLVSAQEAPSNSNYTNLLIHPISVGCASFDEFPIPCETPFPEKASVVARVHGRRHHNETDKHLLRGVSGIAKKVKLHCGQKYCVTAIGKLCANASPQAVKIFVKQDDQAVISSTEQLTTDFQIVRLSFIAQSKHAVVGLGVEGQSSPNFEVQKFTIETCSPCKTGGLNILLTNDDGYTFPGLTGLFTALQAAGHNPIIVAPSGDVDSTSGAINASAVFIAQHAPNIFSVSVQDTNCPPSCQPVFISAFPTTALAQAPNVIPATTKIDLIIVGINSEGNNTGPSLLTSGTVMTTANALAQGLANAAPVPAIGVSGPGNPALIPTIAGFVVDLVNQLQCSNLFQTTGQLLPAFTGLNVNYPNVPVGTPPNGIKITRQGLVLTYAGTTPIGFAYNPVHVTPPPGFILVTAPTFEPYQYPVTDIPDSDSLAVSQKFISITPIDPFLTATPCETREVIDTIAQLPFPVFGTYLPQNIQIPFSFCK